MISNFVHIDKKIKSSTIVEVIVAMIILCIVVLLAYSFLIYATNKKQFISYDFISTPSYNKPSDEEAFTPISNTNIQVKYHESTLWNNLKEVEIVYYEFNGSVQSKRHFLVEDDRFGYGW